MPTYKSTTNVSIMDHRDADLYAHHRCPRTSLPPMLTYWTTEIPTVMPIHRSTSDAQVKGLLRCPRTRSSQMPTYKVFSDAHVQGVLRCPHTRSSEMPTYKVFSDAHIQGVLRCPGTRSSQMPRYRVTIHAQLPTYTSHQTSILFNFHMKTYIFLTTLCQIVLTYLFQVVTLEIGTKSEQRLDEVWSTVRSN